MTLIVSRSQAERIGRLFIGMLLLLPALLCFGAGLWLPLWRTLVLAVEAGLPRILASWSDPHLPPAFLRSGLIAMVQVVAVVLPVALMWGAGPHPRGISPNSLRAVRGTVPRPLSSPQGGRGTFPFPSPRHSMEEGVAVREDDLRPSHPRGGIAAALMLCVGLALSSPVGLALLWRGAVRDLPQPLRSVLNGDPLPFASCLGLELIAVLGLGGGLAVLAMLAVRADSPLPEVQRQTPPLSPLGGEGRVRGDCGDIDRSGRSPGTALTPIPSPSDRSELPLGEGTKVREHHTHGAVLALAALAALGSGLDAAALPLALTGGAPDGRTAPLALHIFLLAFRDRQTTQAAAEALPLLTLCLTLGLALGILCERWRLSIRCTRRPSPPSPTPEGEGSCGSPRSLPCGPKSGQAATNSLSPLRGEGRVRGDCCDNKSSASCGAQSSPPSLLLLGGEDLPSRGQGSGTRLSTREASSSALPPLFVAFLVALPVLLLYLWGLGEWWLAPGRALAHATSLLQMELALLNGSAVPIGTILLIQLPAAYLAALSLTRMRPFGERGSRAASVVLIASGFIPQVVIAIGLYDLARPIGLADGLAGLVVPLAAGPVSYFVFRLGFLGGQPSPPTPLPPWGEGAGAGQPVRGPRNARMGPAGSCHPSPSGRGVGGEGHPLTLLPLALALALLFAGQRLLWPLVVLTRRDLFTLSLRLLALQHTLADHPAALIAAGWLMLTVWGGVLLPLWWITVAVNWGRWELRRGQWILDRCREQSDNAQNAQGSTLLQG